MTGTGYPLAVDVWNTGQTFTGSGHRAADRHQSLQFRDAHRVDTVDLQGRPWTVWWTRAEWDAKAGHFSVLSVLCIGASAPLRAVWLHDDT
jgi:hypothetical protein